MGSRKKSFLLTVSFLAVFVTIGLMLLGIGEAERADSPLITSGRASYHAKGGATAPNDAPDQPDRARHPADQTRHIVAAAPLPARTNSQNRVLTPLEGTSSTLYATVPRWGEPSTLILKGPELQAWEKKHRLPLNPPPASGHKKISAAQLMRLYPLVATATEYRAKIYSAPAWRRTGISYARRGALLRVKTRVVGGGCPGGTWYKERGGGYICTTKGFTVAKSLKKLKRDYVAPDLFKSLPYRYVKGIDKKAVRYYRLPTPAQEKAVARAVKKDDRLPGYVEKQMDGDFFMALDRKIISKGRTFFRTIAGLFVRAKDVQPFSVSQMHGERLTGKTVLPLAFVHKKKTKLYSVTGDKVHVVGKAEKHARFPVKKIKRKKNLHLVVGPKGLAVKRKAVRITRRIKRPRSIPANEKWLHVDVEKQTLVAYKGKKPVFATLVSTGVKGHETPRGLYRVNYKHVTTTMRGPDDKVGWYDVAEVPWTMYYRRLYAIHGAYWHNNFGNTQSHGCTNLAPADARWLFLWTEPVKPPNWHSIRKDGTYVLFSG